MAIYSGNLVAFLTVAKDELPFTSMAGMVQQEKYKWGLYGHGAMHSYLSVSINQNVYDGTHCSHRNFNRHTLSNMTLLISTIFIMFFFI